MKKFFAFILLFALLLCSCGESTDISEDSSEDISAEASAEESDVSNAPAVLDNSMLVVFGDSITALGTWGKTAAQDCNMQFFNGAKGGITTAQGLSRFDAYVASRSPDFVTLCFGMNDLIMVSENTPRVTPEQFKINLTAMVEKVFALNATPLLLTTNPLDVKVFYASQGQDPALYGGRDILAWLDTYNEVTRTVAKETGAYLVDMRAACDEYTVNQIVNPDGIHLSALGNKVFADTLSAFLKENFERDENAPAVNYDNSFTLNSGEKFSLVPTDAALWQPAEPNTMIITGGESLVLKNTNNMWPEAECAYTKGAKVKIEGTNLLVKFSTANVNTSIVLYFDGAYPHAYGEGQYMVLSPYLGLDREPVSGDILANQSIDAVIPLSSLPIPAGCIHDGYVVFSGIKIYVAGNAHQPVTFDFIDLQAE